MFYREKITKKHLKFGVNSIVSVPRDHVVKLVDPSNNIIGVQRGHKLEIKSKKVYQNGSIRGNIYVSIPIDGQITLECYIKEDAN